jgi:hypothetical protein
MKSFIILFIILLLFSKVANSQQTFNELNVKTLNISKELDVVSTTSGSRPCPAMTEAQRDALTPTAGQCVYNTDSLTLNIYNGTLWKAAGGGIENWTTGFNFALNDVVIESNNIYQANTAHTSTVFASDIANWDQLANDISAPTGILPTANGGTNKNITPALGAISYTDADSFELLSAGVSGQFLKSNGAAAPAWADNAITAKAQNGTPQTVSEIQVPSNQLTQTDTNKYLIESGNKNILADPDFEGDASAWTATSVTIIPETTTVINGVKSIVVAPSSSTFSVTQSSTVYSSEMAGVQLLGMIRVRTSVSGIKVCSVSNGTISTTNCVAVNNDSNWGLYKTPFVGSTTSNGIAVVASSAVSGNIYIDDAFVGAQDVQGVQPLIGPWTSWTPTGTWIANTTYSGKYRQVGENYEYDVLISTSGAPTAAALIVNLPSGHVIDTEKALSSGIAGTLGEVSSLDSATTLYGLGQASYETTTTVRVRSLNAATTGTLLALSNTVPFTFGAGDTVHMVFTAPIVSLSGSTSTYSSSNADTDWASCGHTTSGFTGFGTVSAIETQCKRNGGDLLMKGKFTSGTSTAVEARLALPVWNGTVLTSKGTGVIPSIQGAGSAFVSYNSALSFYTLIEPSVTYITFSAQGAAAPALTKQTGVNIVSSGNLMSVIARIPIAGWDNPNQIVGSFKEVMTVPGVSLRLVIMLSVVLVRLLQVQHCAPPEHVLKLLTLAEQAPLLQGHQPEHIVH